MLIMTHGTSEGIDYGSDMTHGENNYWFRVPYTEVIYGHIVMSVTAHNYDEAKEKLLNQEYDSITEYDWNPEDSETDTHWSQYVYTEKTCPDCGTLVPHYDDYCECTYGWNDPDMTTPDAMYGG